jgi:tight adherence protein B
MGKGFTDRLSASLSAAGLSIRPSEFMIAVLGGVVFAQLLAVVLFHNVLGSAAFGLLSLYAPGTVLRFLEHRRQAAFNAQIADAILMISSSLRSGFSFLRGMQMIAKEMPPPISQEFQRVVDEVNVARPLEEALADVVRRVKSYDFDLMCTAVLIQIGVGGNLADVLDSIGNTIRERVQVIGEMRALTAEGKMSGMILMLMPVGVGFLLWSRNPEYMSPLFTDPIGHMMLVVAAVMQLMGGFIIKKMLVLDV